MTHRSYKLTGRLLATIGVLMLLAEAASYYFFLYVRREHYDVNVPLILLGAALGFVGFFILDSKRALEGGQFLVQSATGILAVVRGGAKRGGDTVIGPADHAEHSERPPHLPDPTVTEEHDG